MKQSLISKIISIVLILLFIAGLVCIFFIPNLHDLVIRDNQLLFKEHNLLYKIAFYLCYLISLSIIGVLIYLFKNIYIETPFKNMTVKILKLISILFMILVVIIGIKCIFIPTIISICIGLVCFIVSLSFYVLSQIFKAAIYYKNEVDYTI